MRQRTPPSKIILFWSHVTRVSRVSLSLACLGLSLPFLRLPRRLLSLSRSVGRVGENPGNEVGMQLDYEIILLKKILRNHLLSENLQWNYESFNVALVYLMHDHGILRDIFLGSQQLDCSQSSIFPSDHRDRALCVTGCHLAWVSKLLRGRGAVWEEARKDYLQFSQKSPAF